MKILAESPRKPSGGKQPITGHPLFPAIVALWCGALFGLASLALRPELVEGVVLAAGIDRIIPMAAPPLGATMRILLALAMTGIGAVAGWLLAKRFARPRAVLEKRRAVSGIVAEDAPIVAFGTRHNTETEVAAPEVAAPEVAEPEVVTPASGGRRRRLLSSFESEFAAEGESYSAPSGPQILRVSEFELDGLELPKDEHEGGPIADPHSAEDGHDTDEWHATADWRGLHGTDLESEPDLPTPRFLDATLGGEDDDRIEPSRFDHLDDPDAGSALPLPSIASDDDSQASRPFASRLFDAYARPAAASPAVAGNDTAGTPGESGAATGAAEEPVGPAFELLPSLSSGTIASFASSAAQARESQPENGGEAPTSAASLTPKPFAPSSAVVPTWTDAWPDRDRQGQSLPENATRSAAERIATAPLDQLSHVELLERLALTIERRRSAARSAPSEPAAPEPQPLAVELPESELPQARLETPAVPEVEASEPAALPRAATSIPAALRPIGFDDGDDDGDELPSYVPPRHIGMARAIPESGSYPKASRWSSDEAARADATEDEEEEEGDEALEEGYSSLLTLTKPSSPRQPFIRLEEPERIEAPRPVVIFPGDDAPAAQTRLASTPAESPAEASVGPIQPVRPFDGPRSGLASDETERALRAALSTLQRMSGAA